MASPLGSHGASSLIQQSTTTAKTCRPNRVRSKPARPRSVADAIRDQRIEEAFGAAMTDTSAWLLYRKLSPRPRTVAINHLFGVHGIHLNYVRVPIGAFRLHSRREAAHLRRHALGAAGSQALETLDRARPSVRPPGLARDADHQSQLQILSTTWSPPAWMKTNRALNNRAGGARLRPNAYRPLARYFVNFIRAMPAPAFASRRLRPRTNRTWTRAEVRYSRPAVVAGPAPAS